MKHGKHIDALRNIGVQCPLYPRPSLGEWCKVLMSVYHLTMCSVWNCDKFSFWDAPIYEAIPSFFFVSLILPNRSCPNFSGEKSNEKNKTWFCPDFPQRKKNLTFSIFMNERENNVAFFFFSTYLLGFQVLFKSETQKKNGMALLVFTCK